MKKYITSNKTIISEKQIESLLLERCSLNKEDLRVSWLMLRTNCKYLAAPMYFEIKRELKSPFDFPILKREVLETADELAACLNLDRNYIRLYFNGKDGFYLYLPMDATLILDHPDPLSAMKNAARTLREATCIEDIRTDIYEIDSCHIAFNSMNFETNLYLVNMSYDMLDGFTYKALAKYASEYHSENYYKEIDYKLENVSQNALKLIGGPYEDAGLKEKFTAGCSDSDMTYDSYVGAYDKLMDKFPNKEYLKSVTNKHMVNFGHIHMESSVIRDVNKRQYYLGYNIYSIIPDFIARVLEPWKHMVMVDFNESDEKPQILEHMVCPFCEELPAAYLNLHLKYDLSSDCLSIVTEDMNIKTNLLNSSFERIMDIASTACLNLANTVTQEFEVPDSYEPL